MEDLCKFTEGESVLHCEKPKYDYINSGLYINFKNKLIEHIALQLNAQESENSPLSYDFIINYLNGDTIPSQGIHDEIIATIKTTVVVLNNIAFPDVKSRDSWNYTPILKRLGKIHFNYCEFHTSCIEIKNLQCYFQDCIFHNAWSLRNYKVLDNVDDVIYQACTFKKSVTTNPGENKNTLSESLFCNCSFKELELFNATFKKPIFNNSRDFHTKIENISIHDCTIEDKFILNNHKIKEFRLQDTVFRKKFEFKENKTTKFIILNSNFKGLADYYESKFEVFLVQKSIFEEFVGFERCTFGLSSEHNNTAFLAQFQHATFLNFLNFRYALFHSGLDMRDANLKEYPNFLDAYIKPTITNRETFRIIKHSFDKVGNTVEANKYFSLEMAKDRQETSFWDNPDKKIILWFNTIISNFGQSFMLPLAWIFILSIINILLYDAIDSYTPKTYTGLEALVKELNTFAKHILPFKKILESGKEFISLIFLLGYSTLIYHFIVAVKRITKR